MEIKGNRKRRRKREREGRGKKNEEGRKRKRRCGERRFERNLICVGGGAENRRKSVCGIIVLCYL